MGTRRIRKPDSDLKSYLNFNDDIYTLEDIKTIRAEVAGHNEEAHWFWIIELKEPLENGKYVLTEAYCDYTGWDCVSGGESKVAKTAHQAALLAPEYHYGRYIRENLLDQLKGTQPFGLETVRNVHERRQLWQS